MNTTAPQNPFVPASPPVSATVVPEPTPSSRPKRRSSRAAGPAKLAKAKKPRKAKIITTTEQAIADVIGKKPRKPRAAKKAAKAPRAAGKLDINSIVQATVGLKAEEAKLLLSIVSKLGDLGKSGKVKVVAALAKLFS